MEPNHEGTFSNTTSTRTFQETLHEGRFSTKTNTAMELQKEVIQRLYEGQPSLLSEGDRKKIDPSKVFLVKKRIKPQHLKKKVKPTGSAAQHALFAEVTHQQIKAGSPMSETVSHHTPPTAQEQEISRNVQQRMATPDFTPTPTPTIELSPIAITDISEPPTPPNITTCQYTFDALTVTDDEAEFQRTELFNENLTSLGESINCIDSMLQNAIADLDKPLSSPTHFDKLPTSKPLHQQITETPPLTPAKQKELSRNRTCCLFDFTDLYGFFKKIFS